MNIYQRPLAALALCAMFAASCSSASDPAAAEPAVEPAATPAESTASETDPDCVAEPTATDLWPGLDDVLSGDAAANVRRQTSELTSPYLCQAITIVDPVIQPSEVGAVASASLVYGSPYVRFDLFAFESADRVDGARQTILTALERDLPEGSLIDVAGGPYLYFMASWIDDGSGAVLDDYFSATDDRKEIFDVIDHYQETFFPTD